MGGQKSFTATKPTTAEGAANASDADLHAIASKTMYWPGKHFAIAELEERRWKRELLLVRKQRGAMMVAAVGSIGAAVATWGLVLLEATRLWAGQ